MDTLILLSAFLVYIGTVVGEQHKCYNCVYMKGDANKNIIFKSIMDGMGGSGQSDNACQDKFDKEANLNLQVACPQAGNKCLKAKIDTGDVVMIARSCGNPALCLAADGESVNCCEGNACNGSATYRMSLTAVGIFGLLGFLLKRLC